MKVAIRNFFYLLLIYIILAGAGYAFSGIFSDQINFTDFSILLTVALVFSVVISYIFFRGLKKSGSKSVLYTLSAIGLKFLLFLGLLGVFALIKGDLTWQFLLAFFVIYLAFTFYLLVTFVKVLKLKNQEESDVKEK